MRSSCVRKSSLTVGAKPKRRGKFAAISTFASNSVNLIFPSKSVSAVVKNLSKTWYSSLYSREPRSLEARLIKSTKAAGSS